MWLYIVLLALLVLRAPQAADIREQLGLPEPGGQKPPGGGPNGNKPKEPFSGPVPVTADMLGSVGGYVARDMFTGVVFVGDDGWPILALPPGADPCSDDTRGALIQALTGYWIIQGRVVQLAAIVAKVDAFVVSQGCVLTTTAVGGVSGLMPEVPVDDLGYDGEDVGAALLAAVTYMVGGGAGGADDDEGAA